MDKSERMQGDNFKFSMTAVGDDLLKEAVRMCFVPHDTATRVSVQPGSMTVMGKRCPASSAATFLPCPMKEDAVFAMVQGWLADVAKYPGQPAVDGSCVKGWTVHADWEKILTVEPAWTIYHK